MRAASIGSASLRRITLAVTAVALMPACGSSTDTSTAPSTLPRCGVTLGVASDPAPAAGGTGRLTVATARECAWTASPDADWITITGAASGQGDGGIDYRIAPNTDPVARRGGIRLNDQRAEIAQEAAPCALSLRDSSADFPQSGGSGTVHVVASSPLCTWTAVSDTAWVTIRSGSNGKGSAAVTFDVEPTSGPPRTATLNVAGQRFTVNQSQGCTYAIAPAAQAFGAAGGRGSLEVRTAGGCPWTAASNVDWITVEPPTSSSGSGTVRYAVAATSGPPRSGTLVVGGQVFTVTQGDGCALQVSPPSIPIAAAGGTASVAVAGAAGCGWTATSDARWITVTSGASGSGNGTVALAIAPTDGPARTGTVTVAGSKITVTQGEGCAYAIEPTSSTVPSAGGDGAVAVKSQAGCAWTAASTVSWVQILEAKGSGNGTVRYRVSATSGPSRSGALTIAGQTFIVNQGQGCAYTLAPSTAAVPPAGGTPNFEVQTAAGCAWTAASSAPWVSVADGAGGSGTGTVRLSVAANTGPARSGTVTAGGQAFTVTQEGGCSIALSATSQQVPAGGGSGSVDVTAAAGCGWSASSGAPWISITEGASGSGNGNGTVRFSVAANAAGSRSGTLEIGGRTFTVNQAGACSYAIAPETQNVPDSGGSVTVAVTTAPECAWTTAPQVSWIAVASGGSGSGPAQVQLAVASNPEAQRTGTVTIAGRTFTVVQGAGCIYGISPNPVVMTAPGGTTDLQLTTAPTCSWTVKPSEPWITVASASSGTGPGTIQIAIDANAGPLRNASIAIGSASVPVRQESGCAYMLSAASLTVPSTGGPGTVTLLSGGGCPWEAASTVPWIVITSEPTGAGTQPLQFTVQPNTTGVQRVGTITVAAPDASPLTFTITQGM